MDAMERSEADGVGISDGGGQGRARGKDEKERADGKTRNGVGSDTREHKGTFLGGGEEWL